VIPLGTLRVFQKGPYDYRVQRRSRFLWWDFWAQLGEDELFETAALHAAQSYIKARGFKPSVIWQEPPPRRAGSGPLPRNRRRK
jgi:hypothetical protein